MSASYIGPNAQVYGSAQVYASAQVYGSADIREEGDVAQPGDYVTVGPAVSSGNWCTAHKDRSIGVRVNMGCFSGSLEEFQTAIEAAHAANPAALRQYRAFLALFCAHFQVTL